RPPRLERLARDYAVPLASLVIFLGFSLLVPQFYSLDNLAAIARQVAMNGVIAAGMTLVMISAGIDLSVGSLIAVTSVVLALMIHGGLGLPVSIVLTLLLGAACGAVNGLLVTTGRVPPFIATLATLSILRGVALAVSGGTSVSDLGDNFVFLGRGEVLGVPVPLIILAVVFLVAHALLTTTRFGTYLYAIGGNERTCRTLGIPVDRVKFLTYTLVGTLTALAGIILTARLNSGQPLTGQGAELDAIAAVVVGGTSLFGGRGSVIGTVFGVAIIGMLTNGLVLLDLSFYYQLAVKGLVILAAVWVARDR
ncbi:MAG TPA: ribose ABC transporter permease, partial [Deinococcales bacterium]|nr:ribose ABC transporter permease [Deinococcales bacterium]